MLRKAEIDSVKIITLLILGCVFATLVGCSKSEPLSMSRISGTYFLKYSHGTEVLHLNADGTYSQEYRSNGVTNGIVNRVNWDFDPKSDKIGLMDALLFDNGRNAPHTPPVKSGRSLDVGRSFGRISLSADADGALVFQKQ